MTLNTHELRQTADDWALDSGIIRDQLHAAADEIDQLRADIREEVRTYNDHYVDCAE